MWIRVNPRQLVQADGFAVFFTSPANPQSPDHASEPWTLRGIRRPFAGVLPEDASVPILSGERVLATFPEAADAQAALDKITQGLREGAAVVDVGEAGTGFDNLHEPSADERLRMYRDPPDQRGAAF